MDIIILTMPSGLMLTCETPNYEEKICNFDNLFFNQNDCGTPMLTHFAVFVCSKDQYLFIKFLRRRVLIGLALTS